MDLWPRTKPTIEFACIIHILPSQFGHPPLCSLTNKIEIHTIIGELITWYSLTVSGRVVELVADSHSLSGSSAEDPLYLPHPSLVSCPGARASPNSLTSPVIIAKIRGSDLIRSFCMEGWTYGLEGSLLKAPRITGLRNFNPKEHGLIPISVATWGAFVVVNLDVSEEEVDYGNMEDWLGNSAGLLSTNGVDTSLSYICRREYTLECNWKVFCDNYLDGGYHVPYAHKNLAFGVNLDSYSIEMFEKVSIQRCASSSTETGGDFDRLGSKALYAFVYPNFMINRYGLWMDTNLVIPLGPRKCQVVFDYFLDTSLKIEDIMLCEGVKRGLESPAYNTGRYAPTLEKPMHRFHCLLYRNLTGHTLQF